MSTYDLALGTAMRDVIRYGASSRARNLQTALGPSGVGTDCMRQLAFAAHEVPKAANSQRDPWASELGTWAHSGMAAFLEADNERLVALGGQPRWLIETAIEIPGYFPKATADLFDLWEGCVIDHKFPGQKGYTSAKKGPSKLYRTQVHTYGLGFMLAGHQVNRVAIAYYPRANSMLPDGPFVWSEPWDESVVEKAMRDLDRVRSAIKVMGDEPASYLKIPTPENPDCRFCDWFAPGATDPAAGCPGVIHSKPSADDLLGVDS